MTRGQMSAFLKRLAESDVMPAGAQGPKGDTGATGAKGADRCHRVPKGAAGAQGAAGTPVRRSSGSPGCCPVKTVPARCPGSPGSPTVPTVPRVPTVPTVLTPRCPDPRVSPVTTVPTVPTVPRVLTPRCRRCRRATSRHPGHPWSWLDLHRIESGTTSGNQQHEPQDSDGHLRSPVKWSWVEGILSAARTLMNLHVVSSYPSNATTWSVTGSEPEVELAHRQLDASGLRHLRQLSHLN